MIPLPAFVLARPKLFLYGGATLGIMLGFWALRTRYIEQGKQEGQRTAVEQGKEELEGKKALLDQELADAKAARADAADRERQAADREAQALSTLAQVNANLGRIASERRAIRDAVDALPDSERANHIRAGLGLPPGDLTPDVLRVVDRLVADYPKLEEDNRELKAKVGVLELQVGEVKNQLAAVRDQLAASDRQAAALARWADDLQAQYVLAYNALQRRTIGQKICRALTLSLACRPRRLSLPAPDQLLSIRPR